MDLQQAREAMFEHNKAFYSDTLDTHLLSHIETRIVHILPGSFDDPLRCQLKTENIDSTDYNALSYAWGSSVEYYDINLSGKDGFRVSASVFSALRRLRHPRLVEKLWVDAICINQASLSEKNVQVSNMGSIFQEADFVYVWLGHCNGTLSVRYEIETCNAHTLHRRTLQENTVVYNFIKQFLNQADRTDKTQWWWRTWVLQEVALNRNVTVLIGSHRIPWSLIIRYCNSRFRHSLPEGLEVPLQIRRIEQIRAIRARNERHELLDLLTESIDCVASDARDAVFGILGLALDRNQSIKLPIPDYTKSLMRVCRDATRYIILIQGDLTVLLGGWRRILGRPTWAVDFSKVRSQPSALFTKDEYQTLCATPALGSTYDSFKIKTLRLRFEDNCFTTTGIKYDTVILVAKNEWESYWQFGIVASQTILSRITSKTHENGMLKLLEGPPNDKASIRSFRLKVLHELKDLRRIGAAEMGLKPKRLHNGVTAQFVRTISLDKLREFRDCAELWHRPDQKPDPYGFEQFMEWAWNTLHGRDFFVTRKGLCGVASPGVLDGDAVVLLPGMKVPMVLRPREFENNYTLVSECFMSGVMSNNDRFPQRRKEKLPPAEDFCII